MLNDIVLFEWRCHTRQATFLAAAALFALMGGALAALGFGPDNIPNNSPYLVMEAFGFLSLFALFAAAVFAANAVLRDDDSRMRDIIDSTPAPRFVFVFGRLAGAFLATLTAVAFSILGWMTITSLDARPSLYAFAVITIPNVLFCVALIFAVAMLTRSSIATYSASVVVYFLYLVASALSNSPLMAQSKAGGGGGTIPSLADPFGLTAFFDVTRHWTIAAKSTAFVPLTGVLLANRAIVIGAAIVLAYVAWKAPHPAFGHLLPASGANGNKVRAYRVRCPSPRVSGEKVAEGRMRGFRFNGRIAMELRAFFTKPALLLYLVWIGLALTEINSDVFEAEYGSTMYPATGLIINALMQPLFIAGALLIIYFGSELYWRERRTRMAAIIDSTPVSGATMMGAKWIALTTIIASLIVCSIGIGVTLQIARGYTDFRPLVYLSLFYIAGLPLALYAAASLLIHALSPNKYTGMVLVVMFLFLARRYDAPPPARYSDLIGFGETLHSFNGFILPRAAIALLLVIIATTLWRQRRRTRIAMICAIAALGIGTTLRKVEATEPKPPSVPSGQYELAKRQHGNIPIELYYKHPMNVAHILDVAEASLDVLQAAVGPYPHQKLRIYETPSDSPYGGFALPGVVLLREDRTFLTDMRDPNRFDLIARRVAHEVSHQWFGHSIIASRQPGGLVITESLAKYGELLTLEKLHGRESVRQLLEMELERYLSGRARETGGEVPLNRVALQPYLYYSKGAIVLWAARDLLGADAMTNAIHTIAKEPKPAGANLMRALNNPLIDEWMNDITLYDFRIDDAHATRRADGRWDVTLRVHATKVRSDARGNERPLPMRESIGIAIDVVRAAHVGDIVRGAADGPSTRFARSGPEKRELHDGMNELTFVANAKPQRATVDPWITRIDRNPRDNSKAIQAP